MTVSNELEKIYYFMKRDIISFSTYKTNMLVTGYDGAFRRVVFRFFGFKLSQPKRPANVQHELYHIPVIGLAFSTYLNQSLTLVQKTINPWALEEVLVSPTRLSTFIIGSSLWGFIWSTGVVVVYLAIGVLLLELS